VVIEAVSSLARVTERRQYTIPEISLKSGKKNSARVNFLPGGQERPLLLVA
jgi:hypothetical protein